MKILMVCLGNICRSPLAHGILASKVPSSVVVDSAGTSGYHEGALPDSRSITVAHQHGIDITSQRSRQFTVKDFDVFDIIYVMDDHNYSDILSLARNSSDKLKVKLILNEVKDTKNLNVPDPYYGGKQGFTNVYKMLEKACTNIASNLIL